MNDQPTAKLKQQPRVGEYLNDLAQRRRAGFLLLMDYAAPRSVREEWTRYVDVAVANLGRRQLERVVWPWQHREQTTRTPRGRLSNPTAIPSRPKSLFGSPFIATISAQAARLLGVRV